MWEQDINYNKSTNCYHMQNQLSYVKPIFAIAIHVNYGQITICTTEWYTHRKAVWITLMLTFIQKGRKSYGE